MVEGAHVEQVLRESEVRGRRLERLGHWWMPELDGSTLDRTLQESDDPIRRRLIFVTGDTLSPTTAAFIRGTGAPVVGKPFEIEDLVRTVNRVLGA